MKYSASLAAVRNSGPVASTTAMSKPAGFMDSSTSSNGLGNFGEKTIRGMLAPLRADNAHERDALPGRAPEVVGERELAPARDAGDLPLARLTAKLQPALKQHAQARGADRVTERLQAAVRIHSQFAIEVERAGEHFLPAGAARREAEVLHEDELGRREAVVDLGHGELLARILDPGLRVRVRGGGNDLVERRVVVVGVDRAGGGPRDEGQRLDVQRLVRVAMRVLRADDDGGGRAIAYAGAVEDAQGARDERRARDRVLGHFLAELC